jgi:hypothetical protein
MVPADGAVTALRCNVADADADTIAYCFEASMAADHSIPEDAIAAKQAVWRCLKTCTSN